MSTNIFEIYEICFCPHTFALYFNIPQKERNLFKFLYKFPGICYQVNNLILPSCFACHEAVVRKQNSQITCFIRFFPKKGYFKGRNFRGTKFREPKKSRFFGINFRERPLSAFFARINFRERPLFMFFAGINFCEEPFVAKKIN